MDQQVQKIIPDYKLIYSDIIDKKFPEKKEACSPILRKKKLDIFDIMYLNNILFGSDNKADNQKHRSYSKYDISRILGYQREHKCNNSQLAAHFGISRNTVTKWRKLFINKSN